MTSDGRYSVLSLFSGAGGLDLGFESENFEHLAAVDIDPWCVATLRENRPEWQVTLGDIRHYEPPSSMAPDVLLAGFPCQGFSLGGSRRADDDRNSLYKEVVRITESHRPRVVVIENVLNLRTMRAPGTDQPFAEQIAHEMGELGYRVFYQVFRLSQYGVPQTRRRFVFFAFREELPVGYHLPLPVPGPETTIRQFLEDLASNDSVSLPNHDPRWGFKSAVHCETGEPFDSGEIVPVRFSRTASDGTPIRTLDTPFPAVDTATVWGWAQGHVHAERHSKDRTDGKFIRNPQADVTLWRVSASRLRTFTHREYARLQTFPDDWVFLGRNKRDIHIQVGNAVPVRFAQHLARNVRRALEAIDAGTPFEVATTDPVKLRLF